MIFSSEKLSDAYLELNSCGRQFFHNRDYKIVREKGRMDYHILYLEKGACTVEICGKEHRIPAGNIILFKPYEKQAYGFKENDESISCYIHFSGVGCETLLRDLGLLQNPVTPVGSNRELESIFSNMENEYLLKPPYHTESCAALLLHFLAVAGRFALYKKQEIDIRSRNTIDTVCKHMHANYDKNFSAEFYADMCHLSVSRFAHVFKEHTGTTPKAYILAIKVAMAKKILRSTNLSLSDTARAVGIEDVNYFSRMMKKHTGHSPKHVKN